MTNEKQQMIEKNPRIDLAEFDKLLLEDRICHNCWHSDEHHDGLEECRYEDCECRRFA